MSNISKTALLALMPSGSAWNVEQDGDLDKLLDGMAENNDSVIDAMTTLAYLQDPLKTVMLEELGKEYGIPQSDGMTEAEYRSLLAANMGSRTTTGAADALETVLRSSGYDVYVHKNDPPVDPAQFMDTTENMQDGEANAQDGNPTAQDGNYSTPGDYVVNCSKYRTEKLYTAQDGNMQDGDTDSQDGAFLLSSTRETKRFYTPTDSTYWPAIFFVGGAATRNASGELTAIAKADVPFNTKELMRKIILQYKPMHSWAGLVVTYT